MSITLDKAIRDDKNRESVRRLGEFIYSYITHMRLNGYYSHKDFIDAIRYWAGEEVSLNNTIVKPQELPSKLQEAYRIAVSKEDLSGVDVDILLGIGLKVFSPVIVPVRTVAKFIRWQCVNIDGSIDGEALDEMMKLLKSKTTIV